MKPKCVFAGSTVSLGMGLLFGGLSAVGAYQVSQDPARFHMLMGRYFRAYKQETLWNFNNVFFDNVYFNLNNYI